MEYTPEIIAELQPGDVFVYGSNQYARHGAGSARAAHEKFGAIMNTAPMGLIGQSYGIITASFSDQPVSLEFLGAQIFCLYQFAFLRQDLRFLVTKIGTGIAGFPIDMVAAIFLSYETIRPLNIILPKEFSKH